MAATSEPIIPSRPRGDKSKNGRRSDGSGGKSKLPYKYIKQNRKRRIAANAKENTILRLGLILHKIGGKHVQIKIQSQKDEILSFSTPNAHKYFSGMNNRKRYHHCASYLENKYHDLLNWPEETPKEMCNARATERAKRMEREDKFGNPQAILSEIDIMQSMAGGTAPARSNNVVASAIGQPPNYDPCAALRYADDNDEDEEEDDDFDDLLDSDEE